MIGPRALYDRIAHLYDDDMGRNMPFADAAYYTARAWERPSAVLELGCGTGRITRELIRSGLPVTGLDISSKMLAVLRTRIQTAAVELIQADLRAWPLAARYSTILCPYSLITYLVTDSELEGFLANVRNGLQPGGQLIVDAFIPAPGLRYGEWAFDYRRVLPDGRVLQRWKRIEREAARINVVHRRYGLDGDEFEVVDRLRWFEPEELHSILSGHGFIVGRTDWDYRAGEKPPQARFVTYSVHLPDG